MSENLDTIEKIEPPKWKNQGYIPARYIVAMLAFIGYIFAYMLRININITITAMVKTSNKTNNSFITDPYQYGNDYLENETYAFNGRLVRKFFCPGVVQTSGLYTPFECQIGPAICLFSLSLIECNRLGTISLIFTAVTLQGVDYTGYVVNIIDIAPNFAGTLYGIIGTVTNISAFLAPLTVGILTSNNRETFKQWEKVFYIAGGIYTIDAIVFLLFSSGAIQSWNNAQEKPRVTSQINETFAVESNGIKNL